MCPGYGTEVVVRRPDRNAEVSTGHSSPPKPRRRRAKARTLEGRIDVETSHRPRGRISRHLAFGATGTGEARTAPLEGTDAGAADSIIEASGVGAKDRLRSIRRTAVYGPVCTVVWEGRSREAPPYPDWDVKATCSHPEPACHQGWPGCRCPIDELDSALGLPAELVRNIRSCCCITVQVAQPASTYHRQ